MIRRERYQRLEQGKENRLRRDKRTGRIGRGIMPLGGLPDKGGVGAEEKGQCGVS